MSMRYTEILTSIRKIVRSVNLESKRMEKEYGISIPQLLCLNFLSERTEFQTSQKEIKNVLQLNASTVTGIISRLERKGLISRSHNSQDKRFGMIHITTKGTELLKNAPEPLHEQLILRLKELSTEELENLRKAFAIIIEFLNIEDIDAAPIITAGSYIQEEETVKWGNKQGRGIVPLKKPD